MSVGYSMLQWRMLFLTYSQLRWALGNVLQQQFSYRFSSSGITLECGSTALVLFLILGILQCRRCAVSPQRRSYRRHQLSLHESVALQIRRMPSDLKTLCFNLVYKPERFSMMKTLRSKHPGVGHTNFGTSTQPVISWIILRLIVIAIQWIHIFT